MVISCLTIYAIAFSCVTLLIGRSYAATPVQMDITTRSGDRRGTRIHLNKANTSVVITGDKLPKSVDGPKVLQSSYAPSNVVKYEKLSDDSIRRLNKTHSYFALFDTENNVTRKFNVAEPLRLRHKVKLDIQRSEQIEVKRDYKRGNNKIQNFVAWDTLQDSEMEVRVHYNGVTAKETVVKTGFDEDTGKRQGLKLRQLTDGVRFIQLIYSFDNQIQDCEYLKDKKVIQKFLTSFKEDIERAKASYEISKEEEEEEEKKVEELDEDYIEEDEGKIESYTLDEEQREFEDDREDYGSKYRNITFQVVTSRKDLPKDLVEWMNYPMLKKQCKDNHRILKKLVFDKKHGDEETKKLAENHIERVKRGLEFNLIFPGTKWCGKSHVASKYTALGGFSRTDKCCRTHDYCSPLIPAFEDRFGFFNFRPYTISHCRCDSRRKRDIMNVLLLPGTKWCGKGRVATKYTSLGGFSRTDKCCRVHDTMCPHWIGSLEEKYGLFNWRINTIMHCRCDKRFRACLKMAKTGTANFVGKLFFNVVQTKCFVLKPQEYCLKYSWWGKCEKKEYRKKAYLKDNLSY